MILQHVEPDLFVEVPDLHPSYGYADSTRAKVLRHILVDGLSVKQAVAISNTNVGHSTVYRWVAAIKKGR